MTRKKGGGIVETDPALLFLTSCNHTIIHLSRNMDDIRQCLTQEQDTRAKLSEEISSIWKRREPLYRKICDFEFHIPKIVIIDLF